MREFKKGPFHVSLNTGVAIIPVGIKGAYNSYNRLDWKILPGIINVNYGEPILYDQYKEMSIDELRDYVYEKIAILCDNKSAKEVATDE
jgi:1-acyl-sn-glycerol-3-phosphate acyltransferase